jgi:hypothetical protein
MKSRIIKSDTPKQYYGGNNKDYPESEKDSYGYYFPRLKSQKAITIKFADRLSNLSRMNAWDEERRRQYLAKSKFWKDGSDKPQMNSIMCGD